MWIKILLSYIFGYLKVSVEGYYIERLINICRNQKITVWNIRKKEDIKIYFNIGINDFKKVAKIAKKTQSKIKIEQKRGLPFLLHRYKKRKIFLIFLLILKFCMECGNNRRKWKGFSKYCTRYRKCWFKNRSVKI